MSKIRIGRLGVSKPSPTSAKDLQYKAVLKRLESTGLLRVPTHFFDARMMRPGEWPILGNDHFGCCTFAAPIRVMMNNSIRRGRPLVVSPEEVIRAYLESTGGKDIGAMPVNSLNYLRTEGVKCKDGTVLKIRAFARVNERDPYECRSAVQTFKAMIVAAALPARLDEDRDRRWELTPRDKRTSADDPASLGRHAYPVFGFQRNEEFTVPWDEEIVEESPWTDLYREEAWVIVDNQETDEYLVTAMLEQLNVLKNGVVA